MRLEESARRPAHFFSGYAYFCSEAFGSIRPLHVPPNRPHPRCAVLLDGTPSRVCATRVRPSGQAPRSAPPQAHTCPHGKKIREGGEPEPRGSAHLGHRRHTMSIITVYTSPAAASA